jgi:hypothetical protein
MTRGQTPQTVNEPRNQKAEPKKNLDPHASFFNSLGKPHSAAVGANELVHYDLFDVSKMLP